MARIVTVYTPSRRPFRLVDMSFIRWVKISEALARLGHEVHLATDSVRWPFARGGLALQDGVRRVSLAGIRWTDYDVVKTLFHLGFETLKLRGGADHDFIISKLGSVVGPEDMPGIYFYGEKRERLYAVQEEMNRYSRYVTLLSPPAMSLWSECHSRTEGLLLVPGAAEAEIPGSQEDPYPSRPRPRCLFAGNIYGSRDQPEANRTLVGKLNTLGRLLGSRGIRLFFLGVGRTKELDGEVVTCLGQASYHDSWAFLRHADVGIVVSAGSFMHNNESTKIYHYLRAGLPTVSEAGFPNDHVVTESGLGYVVANGDMEEMADRIADATERDWDREAAIQYVLAHHTWDQRAQTYDRVLKEIAG